jgi:hypothetical protein
MGLLLLMDDSCSKTKWSADNGRWRPAGLCVGAPNRSCRLRSVGAMKKILAAGALCWAAASMPLAHAQDAAFLRARHGALRDALAHNAFGRPLYLESSDSAEAVQGDIYAQVEQPFAVAGPALKDMAHWCDILILHLNVKGCRVAGSTLQVYMGRKFDEPLADAHLFEFLYSVPAAQPDYLQVALRAEKGPLGTSHYVIALEVVALDARRSFLHLSYAYEMGRAARWAAQGYLATIGRAKVGFTVTGTSDGAPVYIGGTRGAVERNAMRCYVAVEAYLGSLAAPAAEQTEKRLRDWFAGIERYPVQLHELELGEYLDMKHQEIRRQSSVMPAQAGIPPGQ